MSQFPSVQEIFELQGYLVLRCYRRQKIGDVIPSAIDECRWEAVQGPMIVTGVATYEDYVRQHHLGTGRRPPQIPGRPHLFYKVVAE